MPKSKTKSDRADKSDTSVVKRPKRKDKLSLTTSSRDYGGTLDLPNEVSQREHETTGQFFRRLDRLVAKAKAEASIESRFDMSLSGKQQATPNINKSPKTPRETNFKRGGKFRADKNQRHDNSKGRGRAQGKGKESRSVKQKKRFRRRGK